MSLTLDSKFTSVGRQRHFAMDIRPYVPNRFVFMVILTSIDRDFPSTGVQDGPGLFQSNLSEHFLILEFIFIMEIVQVYF